MRHLSPAEIETIRVPEPKHNPFTLESLVAWLERQDAEKMYDYCDASTCLIAQYLRENGIQNYVIDTPMIDLPQFWNIANSGRSPISTFGAALTRARAALASQKGNANG